MTMTMTLRPLTKQNTWLAEHIGKAEKYNGQELRPFDSRPGAMDAYHLPSVINGVRTPRALPICVPTTNRVN
jgi:hypothetical protein